MNNEIETHNKKQYESLRETKPLNPKFETKTKFLWKKVDPVLIRFTICN
jgi:hypothetical protein